MTNIIQETSPLIPEQARVEDGNGLQDSVESKVTPPTTIITPNIRESMERMRSSVFFRDETHGWLPGHLVEKDEENGIATVLFKDDDNNEKDTSSGGGSKEREVKIKLDLKNLSQSILLQCVDDNGSTVVVEDMRDLPYSNEASILYNLKERYQGLKNPYTRATNNVLVAINPYHWVDGLYSHDKRNVYSERIVWKNESNLSPHLYEISAMALKGILMDGNNEDQTIVVSGESGSGKTTSSKILMAHLATFHEQEYIPDIAVDEERAMDDPDDMNNNNSNDDNDKKTMEQKEERKWVKVVKNILTCGGYSKSRVPTVEEEERKMDIPLVKSSSLDISANGFNRSKVPNDANIMQDTNIIVQRVIDSNPLLEAFGNAKTCLNDNSSRFSRYSKLQFHVEDGLFNPMAHIAGSTCHTFLLEKSRVVSHESSNDERTFHIFYQLMEAPEEEKERIWSGLVGKTGSSFKYIGDGGDNDEYTNQYAWKNTISALSTIGVEGDDLQKLLTVVCIVLQLGNLTFGPNPANEEEAIITNDDELQTLAEMIGIDSDKLCHCLTHKNMTTNRDTFELPLKVADAKSTCDAFAKECYRALFDWLVTKTNESTCADSNYKDADRVTRYKCISILDICGFECFKINGFEQLLINHTNERLQKTFTETIIDSVIEEHEMEGIPIEKIEHNDNDGVIKFLEGRMGLISLLNEQCLLPKASDAAFVRKVYATHDSENPTSKLFFKKHFQLEKNSKSIFGIKHFAKDVVYDATGFLMKNKDTVPFDVIKCATQSTNDIISNGLQLHESSTPKKKGALTGTSLWSSFERQMTSLFIQIKQTRIWFVRCIIPNTKKQPFALDLKCTLSQLRSVGILAALEMSHASYPNKQMFKYIVQRFWLLGKFGSKYSFGNLPEDDAIDQSELREDCHQLLQNVFTQDVSNPKYRIGKTKVYFRAGSLEYLESERSKAYDTAAAKIQARVRGIRDRKLYKKLKIQSKQEKEIVVDNTCGLCIIQ